MLKFPTCVVSNGFVSLSQQKTSVKRKEKYGKFVINVDKRYAFITPAYLLLTPEANWYPKTGVTYSSENVRWYQPEFINFNLEVKTKSGLKVKLTKVCKSSVSSSQISRIVKVQAKTVQKVVSLSKHGVLRCSIRFSWTK